MTIPMLTVLVFLHLFSSSAGAQADAVEPVPQDPRSAVPTMTIPSLSGQVAASHHQDGTIDIIDLERLMKSLREQIDGTLILVPKARRDDAQSAATPSPLLGTHWRLWVFWSMDVPECTGLASALISVHASGLADVRPVHLASLRHWEEWLFTQNDHREQLLQAAHAGDQAACRTISDAWLADVDEMRSMSANFYHGGIRAMSDTSVAVLLKVDSAPCFRLISPRLRVHALDGFGPGLDLVTWIQRCQGWENDHQSNPAVPDPAP